MTKKEYNALRVAIYNAAMQNPEIKRTIDQNGVAQLWNAVDATGQHKILVLSARTQLNDNTFRDNGLDPETVAVRKLLTLNRQTGAATL